MLCAKFGSVSDSLALIVLKMRVVSPEALSVESLIKLDLVIIIKTNLLLNWLSSPCGKGRDLNHLHLSMHFAKFNC